MSDGYSVKFSTIDWLQAQGVVIVADSEVTTLVGQNVTYSGSRVWRTIFDGSTDAGISIDLGIERTVQIIFVQVPRFNGSYDFDIVPYMIPTDKIRIKLSLTTPDAGDVHDTTLVEAMVQVGFGTYALALTNPVQIRYIRVDFDIPSRETEGFFDVLRITAGPMLRSDIGMDWGGDDVWQSNSVIGKAARSNDEFVSEVDGYRTSSFSLNYIKDDEIGSFEDFERRLTTAGRFICIREDRPIGREVMMCRQSTSGGLKLLNTNKTSKSMRVVESF